MAVFLPCARFRMIESTLLTYRVRRKGSVLRMLAAVSPFMALALSPVLLIVRFIDRGPPKLEPACSYPAQNAYP
jgi:hypothetical protein